MPPKPRATPKPAAAEPAPLEVVAITPAKPAEPQPTPAAEPAAAPKKAKKQKPRRPPIPLPSDADELLALDLPALDRLSWEASIRLGKAKQRRAEMLAAPEVAEAAVQRANGEIAMLGPLLHAINHRRGQLRAEARRALGREVEHAEAIAIAAANLLSGGLYRRVLAEAARIQQRAADDLAAA